MIHQPHWLESRWQLPKGEAEILAAHLELMGSLGSYEVLGVDDNEEAKRVNAELVAYFSDGDSAVLKKRLEVLSEGHTELKSIERLPQGDWATAWKQYFKPFALTPEIVIRPSWETYEAKPGERIVVLDPGMAFGTGQHDTTRFCAEFLCEVRRTHPHLQSLLDIGCGSGILSLIGRTMGFTDVVGVDNDPAAFETSQENLARNPNLAPVSFRLTDGSLKDGDLKPADVVVANIIAEALCEMRDTLMSLVKPGGLLILSGILPERSQMVHDAFDLVMKRVTHHASPHWHADLYSHR